MKKLDAYNRSMEGESVFHYRNTHHKKTHAIYKLKNKHTQFHYWFGNATQTRTDRYVLRNNEWVALDTRLSALVIASLEGIEGRYIDVRGGATTRHGYFNNLHVKNFDPASKTITFEGGWTAGGYTRQGRQIQSSGCMPFKFKVAVVVDNGELLFKPDAAAIGNERFSGCGRFTPEGMIINKGQLFALEEDTGTETKVVIPDAGLFFAKESVWNAGRQQQA